MVKPNTARARLDADRTAEPLTQIVHHPPRGGCLGPYMPLVEPEYVDENGGRTPLGAEANEQKRAIVERLLAAWEKVPMLRFGQFLECSRMDKVALFHVEDETLAESAEAFAAQKAAR